MCTYVVEQAEISGHGKGTADWIRLTQANVYYNHPSSAPLDHALIVDLADPSAGPSARISVELSAEAAQALVKAIQAALASGQAQHDLTASGQRIRTTD